MPDENQEKSEIQTATTADGTPLQADLGLQEAPASETTITTPAPEVRGRVSGVEDYERQLTEALAPAPEEIAPPAGENPPAVAAVPVEQAADPAEIAPAEVKPVEEQREFRPRLSSLDDRQKEAILLAKELKDKGEGITLSEAERRIALKYGDDAASPQDPVQSERTAEAIQAEIDLKIAEAEASAEALDVKAALAAQREISKLEREMLRLSEVERSMEAQAEIEFKGAVEISRSKVGEVYPMANDAAHALHAEAARIWSDMEAQSNPMVFDSDAPFKVYQMAANNLSIAPASTSAPKPKSPTSATPRPQAVQQSAVLRPNQTSPVASGGERTTQPGPAVASNGFGKIRNAHEYERTLRELGVSM